MKKVLVFLVFTGLLLHAVVVSADYLYTVGMQVSGSGSTWNGWQTDYETSDGGEAFCVEYIGIKSELHKYDLYTVDESLANLYELSPDYVDLLEEATWYANAWKTDLVSKETAQIAIWETLFTFTNPSVSMDDPTSEAEALMLLFDGAADQGEYTSDWLLAVSPSNPGVININETGQNFLVAAPVPEPATMMLLGIGLLGLAGIGRRKV